MTDKRTLADLQLLDGDTGFDPVQRDRIRFDGFNAFETEHGGRETKPVNPFGAASTLGMEDLADAGATVNVSNERDVYGRKIGQVTLNGQDMADPMIEAGLATASFYESAESRRLMDSGTNRRTLGLEAQQPELRRAATLRDMLEDVGVRFDPARNHYVENNRPRRRKGGTFGLSWDRGVDELQLAGGGLLSYIGHTTGLQDLADYGDKVVMQNSAQLSLNPSKVANYDAALENPETLGTYVVETLGESLPSLLPSVLAGFASMGVGAVALNTAKQGIVKAAVQKYGKDKALGALGALGPSMFAGLQTTGSAQGERVELGADLESYTPAFVGLLSGAANFVPGFIAFSRAAKAVGLDGAATRTIQQRAMDVAKTIHLESMTEAPTGVFELMAEDLGRINDGIKELDDIQTADYLDTAMRGAIGGAAFGASTSVISNTLGMVRETYRKNREQMDAERAVDAESVDQIYEEGNDFAKSYNALKMRVLWNEDVNRAAHMSQVYRDLDNNPPQQPQQAAEPNPFYGDQPASGTTPLEELGYDPRVVSESVSVIQKYGTKQDQAHLASVLHDLETDAITDEDAIRIINYLSNNAIENSPSMETGSGFDSVNGVDGELVGNLESRDNTTGAADDFKLSSYILANPELKPLAKLLPEHMRNSLDSTEPSTESLALGSGDFTLPDDPYFLTRGEDIPESWLPYLRGAANGLARNGELPGASHALQVDWLKNVFGEDFEATKQVGQELLRRYPELRFDADPDPRMPPQREPRPATGDPISAYKLSDDQLGRIKTFIEGNDPDNALATMQVMGLISKGPLTESQVFMRRHRIPGKGGKHHHHIEIGSADVAFRGDAFTREGFRMRGVDPDEVHSTPTEILNSFYDGLIKFVTDAVGDGYDIPRNALRNISDDTVIYEHGDNKLTYGDAVKIAASEVRRHDFGFTSQYDVFARHGYETVREQHSRDLNYEMMKQRLRHLEETMAATRGEDGEVIAHPALAAIKELLNLVYGRKYPPRANMPVDATPEQRAERSQALKRHTERTRRDDTPVIRGVDGNNVDVAEFMRDGNNEDLLQHIEGLKQRLAKAADSMPIEDFVHLVLALDELGDGWDSGKQGRDLFDDFGDAHDTFKNQGEDAEIRDASRGAGDDMPFSVAAEHVIDTLTDKRAYLQKIIDARRAEKARAAQEGRAERRVLTPKQVENIRGQKRRRMAEGGDDGVNSGTASYTVNQSPRERAGNARAARNPKLFTGPMFAFLRSLRTRFAAATPELALAFFTRPGEKTTGGGRHSFEHQRAINTEQFFKMLEDVYGESPERFQTDYEELLAGGDPLHLRLIIQKVRSELMAVNPDLKLANIPVVLDTKLIMENPDMLVKVLTDKGMDAVKAKRMADIYIHRDPELSGLIEPAVQGDIFDDPVVRKAFLDAGLLDTNAHRAISRFMFASATRLAWDIKFGRPGEKNFNSMSRFEEMTSHLVPYSRAHNDTIRFTRAVLGHHNSQYHASFDRFNNIAIGFSSLKTLLFSGVASIPEFALVMARSGEFEMQMAGLHGFIKTLKQTQSRAELVKFAKDLGIMEDFAARHAVEGLYQTGAMTVDSTMSKLVHGMFTVNQQYNVTKMNQLFAAYMGRQFFTEHGKRARKGDQRSRLILNTFGLHADDIRMADKLMEVYGDLPDSKTLEPYREALHRFRQESVLSPKSMELPLYAHDPRFKVLFHLQAYLYAVHSTLNRGIIQGSISRDTLANYGPGLAGTGIALMALAHFSNMIRDMIKAKDTDDEDDFERLWRDYTTTGMLGPLSKLEGAYEMSGYGKNFVTVLMGPTVSTAADVMSGDALKHPANHIPVIGQIPWLRNPINKELRNKHDDDDE